MNGKLDYRTLVVTERALSLIVDEEDGEWYPYPVVEFALYCADDYSMAKLGYEVVSMPHTGIVIPSVPLKWESEGYRHHGAALSGLGWLEQSFGVGLEAFSQKLLMFFDGI